LKNKKSFIKIWAVFLLILSCTNPYQNFEITDDFLLEPGKVYKLTFDSAVDNFPIGTIFQSGNELESSPLSRMYRKPVIIKADDLIARVSKNWRRFIEWSESKSYHISLGLICNSLANASARDINYLKKLNKWKNEIWLHGWDHELSETLAEFDGKSLQEQKKNLQASIKWAKKKLNLDLKTFGSPGNRTDESTLLAVKANPEIEVWFHSNGLIEEPHIITIDWIAELNSGMLRSFNDFIHEVNKHNNDDIIVLQIHPASWDEKELKLFEKMVDYTINIMGRRLVTPYGQFTWSKDKFNLKVEKIGENEYAIDCSSIVYSHRLDIDIEILSFEEAEFFD
tara:strand:+ start:9085 stop:10101 length:1017 start_codon:yes stop_codon:yes gene_type:complete